MSLYLGTTPIADGASTALLADKADVDLTNVNASGTSLASGWSMPSSRYIDLTLLASGSTYTAPANGWVSLYTNARSSSVFAFSELGIPGINLCNVSHGTSVSWGACAFIPVRKGQTFYATYGTTVSGYTRFRFHYAEGENV